MSLDFNIDEVSLETRTIIAEEDDRMAGIKKGDRIMSPVTNALIWQTMAVGIGVINDETAPEFAARLAFLRLIHGGAAELRRLDAEKDEWIDRPLTLEDVEAHKGLSTNVFPMETRAAWIKRITQYTGPFAGVTEPKKPRRR